MGRQVIVIAGPTCSGKTALGIKLAKLLNGEVISADSRQIYKYLDIGTAKPSFDEMDGVKHHLIDFLEPDVDYNVSLFEQDAIKIIEELLNKNIQPIIVGGSGLYIKAVTEGIFEGAETDEQIRQNLQRRMEQLGAEALLNELKIIDPESAAKMLPSNHKRIIRALEVFYLTGKTISSFQKEYKRKNDFTFCKFMLNYDRESLYKRIEKRVDNMIEMGLVDEVKKITDLGYNRVLNSLNTVGYKEIFDYLDNFINLERAVELIKRNTRRYAKRQFTWFNGQKDFIKVDLNDNTDIKNTINLILEKIK
jgi:tRNA dimethylallyltransferase